MTIESLLIVTIVFTTSSSYCFHLRLRIVREEGPRLWWLTKSWTETIRGDYAEPPNSPIRSEKWQNVTDMSVHVHTVYSVHTICIHSVHLNTLTYYVHWCILGKVCTERTVRTEMFVTKKHCCFDVLVLFPLILSSSLLVIIDYFFLSIYS